MGLSPRVRGNRRTYTGVLAPLRSIPACAGEPSLMQWNFSPCTVYPRVCGGTLTILEVTLEWTGLSPRVRGNLVQTAATLS